MTAPFCATDARKRGDSLTGTAAPARRWLLVEHDGPWAPSALESPGLRDGIGRALHAAAAAVEGRALLIRRPGRRPHREVRSWAVVDHGGAQQWGAWHHPEDLRAAATVMRRGPEPPATARLGSTPPLVLVCTHGRHDACCAVRGRPVVTALSEQWADRTWECSHIGGDRFAPNVLLLPDGAYYGNLDESTATAVVDAHLRGTVTTRHFRGVSTQPPAVQAALAAVLSSYGPAGLGDVRDALCESTGEDEFRVTIVGTGRLPVLVQADVSRGTSPPASLTCRAVSASSAYSYTVGALRIPSIHDGP
ncbi:sucrase ferredoxin [Pedococcus sp. KACC 23699]|uniref:Sucrase ferredoxin n=1 Tax=Pedococcus sp. KACC 23699 TaxID=3149228 RepID=A0AAU7JXT5_9MICO